MKQAGLVSKNEHQSINQGLLYAASVEQTVSANNYPRTRRAAPRTSCRHTLNSAKQTPRPVLFNAHINAQHHHF
jgi:hypothetical protein